MVVRWNSVGLLSRIISVFIVSSSSRFVGVVCVMAIQIINCPSCDTFLLDDTGECPECGHVVNADRAAKTQHQSLPTDAAVDGDMEACPKCGETCRQGLVRCWSCEKKMKSNFITFISDLSYSNAVGECPHWRTQNIAELM